MVRRAALLAALLGATGCAGTTVDVLAGYKVRDGGFHGSGPTATFRLSRPVTDSVRCEYEHVSHWLVGPPFGDSREEDSLDQLSCGFRFGLGQ